MSRYGGRKAPMSPEAKRHQERVERARYTLPIEVVTVEDDTDPEPNVNAGNLTYDDPEHAFFGQFWGDPEGSR